MKQGEWQVISVLFQCSPISVITGDRLNGQFHRVPTDAVILMKITYALERWMHLWLEGKKFWSA